MGSPLTSRSCRGPTLVPILTKRGQSGQRSDTTWTEIPEKSRLNLSQCRPDEERAAAARRIESAPLMRPVSAAISIDAPARAGLRPDLRSLAAAGVHRPLPARLQARAARPGRRRRLGARSARPLAVVVDGHARSTRSSALTWSASTVAAGGRTGSTSSPSGSSPRGRRRTACEVRVAFWTEPQALFDRLHEPFPSPRRLRRDWDQALRRLRDLAESEASGEPVKVAGTEPLPTLTG